jgi:hypothetical protein
MFMTSYGYISLFSGLSLFGYFGYRTYRWASTLFRSLFNAKKYLNPESPISYHQFGTSNAQPSSISETPRAFAVIYGIGNRAGGTFA